MQLTGYSDEISWLPCATGLYSAKSAYEMQFIGQNDKPHLEKVWKAKVEEKNQVFPLVVAQEQKLDLRSPHEARTFLQSHP
jgi:hypothetical protein